MIYCPVIRTKQQFISLKFEKMISYKLACMATLIGNFSFVYAWPFMSHFRGPLFVVAAS